MATRRSLLNWIIEAHGAEHADDVRWFEGDPVFGDDPKAFLLGEDQLHRGRQQLNRFVDRQAEPPERSRPGETLWALRSP
ncbi:MAG: hypothetical protein CO108_07090 [Deltaproteobacteria bacterium CG_4_9_14_3_um_filter_63_12]|nr:MAG: hypothetical protein COW42_13630 [Deltaproteobacteria bacterium CG17_big_fil_post_rev_8_21_14_2_50_63_7]PJB45593.1 MAG: hypothetical protein CO108_07090 [Deltaproteobacteria bacterium CG_4_9_14_3_um_filter_63_12]